MEKSKNPEEVDLLQIFLRAVNTVRANFWLILVFFCIGTALGLTYYYTSIKVYESKMVISSGILTRSYSKTLIDVLNRHRRDVNYKAIMNLLNVSEETVKKIIHLDIENLSQIDDQKETDRFIITASVRDQEIFPDLQKGLIHYLETNEFVRVRVEQNENYLKQMVAKMEAEIKDMEEFKQKIITGAFFETAKGNVMFDPTTVNSKILELTKEKINLQNSLALVNSVQVIEGFTVFERPTSPRLSISLISGSLVGLVFVAILIAFKSIRRLLRMADEAKQNA